MQYASFILVKLQKSTEAGKPLIIYFHYLKFNGTLLLNNMMKNHPELDSMVG